MSDTHPMQHLASPERLAEAKDRTVKCCECGGPAVLDGFLVAVLRTWNDRATNKGDFLTPADIEAGCSPACVSALYTRKHEAAQRENETTRAYLGMLLVGNYNPESLAWLRAHGLGAYVHRQLAKEGTDRRAP